MRPWKEIGQQTSKSMEEGIRRVTGDFARNGCMGSWEAHFSLSILKPKMKQEESPPTPSKSTKRRKSSLETHREKKKRRGGSWCRISVDGFRRD